MNEAKEKIEQFKRDLLEEQLSKVEPRHREFFNRLYPKGPRTDQMDWAIQQVMNTVKEIDSRAKKI